MQGWFDLPRSQGVEPATSSSIHELSLMLAGVPHAVNQQAEGSTAIAELRVYPRAFFSVYNEGIYYKHHLDSFSFQNNNRYHFVAVPFVTHSFSLSFSVTAFFHAVFLPVLSFFLPVLSLLGSSQL